MTRIFTPVLFLSLFLATNICATAQTTYYVSAATGNDANNGTASSTPFKTVQKAIAATQASADAGVEIHVEAGVYKPTDGTGDATNRDAAFNLIRGYQNNAGKSLKVYGGYNFATGTRDFIHTPSYLDGDIGTAGDASDNSYHVVAITNTSSATDSLVMDGFTVLHGAANGSGSYLVNPGASLPRYQAGGLYLVGNYDNTKLVVRNCTFTNNTALEGGAVCILSSVPYIKNCVFNANSATQYSGGAIYSNTSASATVANCALLNNTAGLGSAVSHNSIGTLTMTNCTLAGNSGAFQNTPGALYVQGGTAVVTSTIVWGNSGSITADGGVVTVTYSDVQGGFNGTGNINSDPVFLNSSNGPGEDGYWMTSDDGLVIGACSPAKDAGNNSAVPGDAATDLKGSPRIVNSVVDMGAYESTEVVASKTAYRDSDEDGYGDPENTATYTCTLPQGFITDNTDCDDSKKELNPATVWVLDADGDNYYSGDPVKQCASPGAGYVIKATQVPDDCNDNDAAINPGTLWYKDADGDGYSDGTTLTQCERPDGYKPAAELTGFSSDCRDDLASINPGAAEICGNGIDENCDGADGSCGLTVNISDGGVFEGSKGTVKLYMNVYLSEPATGKYSVSYVTRDGTAIAGSDYKKTKGTVSFSKGQRVKTITITVYSDKVLEGDEYLEVVLQNAKGVPIGTGVAKGYIYDYNGAKTTTAAEVTGRPETPVVEKRLVVPNFLHRNEQWRIPSLPANNQVIVTDMNGRVIMQARNYGNGRSFSNAATGMYFYQIQTTNSDGKPVLYKGKLLITD